MEVAHYNLGVALLALKKPAEAKDALEKALSLAPGEARTRRQLERAAAELAQREKRPAAPGKK